MARRASLIFGIAGAVLLVAGVISAGTGLLNPGRVRAFLPELSIDTGAIGGATVALGVGLMVLGAGQLALSLALRRRLRPARPVAAALGAAMSALSLASSAAAAVSAVSYEAAALPLLGGVGLLAAVGLAYAWATVDAVRSRSAS